MDTESDGQGEPAPWLLETFRALQRAVAAAPEATDPGGRICEALAEPAGTTAAWIGRLHPESGLLETVAGSQPLPSSFERPGSAPTATETAIEQDSVLIQDAADNEEYHVLQEAGLPAAERTVSIPLAEAGSVGVLHLYTVDGVADRTDPDAFSEIGELVSTGFRHVECRRQLAHERDRLEALRSLVSHDLGNPLNLAAGRLDLARTEVESEHLDHVENALHQLDSLTDEGQKFVKVGREIEERRPVELTELASECWKYSGSETGTLDVEDATVRAEPERLRMLLNQLFENAVVHNEEGVTVTVGPLDSGGFFVEDDGEGIPAEDREHVFDRGYTTDSDRQGHGLAVVEEIARAHGWTVGFGDPGTAGTRIEVETDRW